MPPHQPERLLEHWRSEGCRCVVKDVCALLMCEEKPTAVVLGRPRLDFFTRGEHRARSERDWPELAAVGRIAKPRTSTVLPCRNAKEHRPHLRFENETQRHTSSRHVRASAHPRSTPLLASVASQGGDPQSRL